MSGQACTHYLTSWLDVELCVLDTSQQPDLRKLQVHVSGVSACQQCGSSSSNYKNQELTENMKPFVQCGSGTEFCYCSIK